MEEIIETSDKLSKRFHFIDNLYLRSEIDKLTKRQKVYSEIKLNDGLYVILYSIGCIHVGLATINLKEYKNVLKYPEEKKKFLDVISSEKKLKLIEDLDLNERFFALNSWIQGIADYGIDSIFITAEIEKYANFASRITEFLLKSLIEVNFKYLSFMIESLEKYEPEILKNFYEKEYQDDLKIIEKLLDKHKLNKLKEDLKFYNKVKYLEDKI